MKPGDLYIYNVYIAPRPQASQAFWQPCGSLVVFEADSLDAARAQAARDPYVQEGVFEQLSDIERRLEDWPAEATATAPEGESKRAEAPAPQRRVAGRG